MKNKNITYGIVIFLALFQFLSSENAFSQLVGCNSNAVPYSGGTVPPNGLTTQFTTCMFATEYSPVIVVASGDYRFMSSYSTDFLTLCDTQNNILFDGTLSPLDLFLVPGTYHVHINTDASCGTNTICRSFSAKRLLVGTATVQGSVFIDLDCNGTYELGDITLPNSIVYTTGYPLATTNYVGNYYGYLSNDPLVDLFVNPMAGYSVNDFQLSPVAGEVYPGMDFAYCPVASISDLAITISATSPPPVPGFQFSYQVCYNNYGTVAADGSIVFDFTNMPGVTVQNAAGGVVAGTTITWDVASINIFNQQCFTVSFLVNQGTTVGTSLNPIVSIIIDPLLTDNNLTNNSNSHTHSVVSSYDPNDKTVDFPVVNYTEIPEGEGVQLEYLIRFQNTGNAPANFVRVIDALPELLDINSIHMISASHNYELIVPAPNVLEWFFEDIMLPDSTTDEQGSHGFIHFRINTIANVELEDIIENNASIYFDFNAPIITDYAVTTFMDCSEGSLEIIIPESICAGEEFVLSPNRDDFNDYQWIVDGDLATGAELTVMLNENSLVQLFANHPVCSLSTTLDVAVIQPPTMYLILGPYVSCTGAMEIETFCSADFSWYLNDNNQGSGDPFIATESGLYNVNCENECGVDNTNIVVEIYDTASAEIVLDENGQLTVNPPGQSYIWYFNGEPILGANAQSYTPTQSGDYSVTVIFSSGCGSTSNMLFVPVSVGEELADKIQLFPNPANENVMLELPQGNWQISFTDITGKTLLEKHNLTEGRHNINLNALSGGLYLIRISSESGSVVKKMMVNN
jgi:uncharacterized repeat protein (TIGR01451 family)